MIITENIIKFFSDNLDFELIDRLCGESMKEIIIDYLKNKINKNINNEDINSISIDVEGDFIYESLNHTIVAWITSKYIKIELLHYNDDKLISDYSLIYDLKQIRKDKLKKLL